MVRVGLRLLLLLLDLLWLKKKPMMREKQAFLLTSEVDAVGVTEFILVGGVMFAGVGGDTADSAGGGTTRGICRTE